MNRSVLALFERALRVDLRSGQIAIVRTALAGFILVCMWPMQLAFGRGSMGAPGLAFFSTVMWASFVFITLAGLGHFASVIAEEKEVRMLGLLRMTGLSPAAILLGKSTGRLVSALLFLALTLPFALLAVTLGGVGTRQVLAGYVALTAYLVFLANLALVWSVLCAGTVHAASFTGLSLALLYGGPAAGYGIATHLAAAFAAPDWLGSLATLCEWCMKMSAPGQLRALLTTGFAGPVMGSALLVNLAAGVLFFMLAWVVFDWATREQKDVTPARGPVPRMIARHSPIPPGRLNGAAVTWKDVTFMIGGFWGGVVRVALVLLGIGLVVGTPWAVEGHMPTREYWAGACLGISGATIVLALAFDVGRVFNLEMQGKTLSGLVLLPISTRELILRKAAVCLKGILPLLPFPVLACCLAPNEFKEAMDALFTHPERLGFILIWVSQILLFLFMVAYFSLVVKRGALLLALGVYYGGGMAFGILSAVTSLFGHGHAIGGFVVLELIAVAALIALWNLLMRRLETVAASESG